jgi:hypothetical protein
MKMAASCETTVIYRQWLVTKCNEALELSRTILLPLVTKHLWLGAGNSILGRSPTQSVGPWATALIQGVPSQCQCQAGGAFNELGQSGICLIRQQWSWIHEGSHIRSWSTSCCIHSSIHS